MRGLSGKACDRHGRRHAASAGRSWSDSARKAFRSPSAASATAAWPPSESAQAKGYRVQFVRGDMAEEAFCRRLVDEALQQMGQDQLPGQQRLLVHRQGHRRHARGLAADDGRRADRLRHDGQQRRVEPMERQGRRRDRQPFEHLGPHRPAQPLDLQRGQGGGQPVDPLHGVGPRRPTTSASTRSAPAGSGPAKWTRRPAATGRSGGRSGASSTCSAGWARSRSAPPPSPSC